MDDSLGKNPLEGELDSIWKIPKGRPASTEAEGGPQENGAWLPVPDEPVDEALLEDHALSDTEMEAAALMAEAVAIESVEPEESIHEETVQFVGFRLENELFALDILKVQEIIRPREITRVPRSDSFIKGVVNLRGKVLPVVSLKERFVFGTRDEITETTRIVVVNTDLGMVGMMVDAVTEVLCIPKKAITPPPSTFTRLDTEYIEGVGNIDEKLIVILDCQTLFGRDEHQ